MTVAAAAVSVAATAESVRDSSVAAAVGLLLSRVLLIKSSLFFPFPDAASANPDDGIANSLLIA